MRVDRRAWPQIDISLPDWYAWHRPRTVFLPRRVNVTIPSQEMSGFSVFSFGIFLDPVFDFVP